MLTNIVKEEDYPERRKRREKMIKHRRNGFITEEDKEDNDRFLADKDIYKIKVANTLD